MKKAEDGYQIKVGDVIVHKSCFGGGQYKVHRVTPKYAFVCYNERAEGKYPRIVGWDFRAFPRSDPYPTEQVFVLIS